MKVQYWINVDYTIVASNTMLKYSTDTNITLKKYWEN